MGTYDYYEVEVKIKKLSHCKKATGVKKQGGREIWFPGDMPFDTVMLMVRQFGEINGTQLVHIDAVELLYPFLKVEAQMLKLALPGRILESSGRYPLRITKLNDLLVDIQPLNHYDD